MIFGGLSGLVELDRGWLTFYPPDLRTVTVYIYVSKLLSLSDTEAFQPHRRCHSGLLLGHRHQSCFVFRTGEQEKLCGLALAATDGSRASW